MGKRERRISPHKIKVEEEMGWALNWAGKEKERLIVASCFLIERGSVAGERRDGVGTKLGWAREGKADSCVMFPHRKRVSCRWKKRWCGH